MEIKIVDRKTMNRKVLEQTCNVWGKDLQSNKETLNHFNAPNSINNFYP